MKRFQFAPALDETQRLFSGIWPMVALAIPPGKVKALRREGPKRGAKELVLIIGRHPRPVNSPGIRNPVHPLVG